MLGPSLINQNEFSYDVKNPVIARVLFSAMLGHFEMNPNELSDASKQIFFSSIVCSNCKSTIFFILWCIKTHFVLKFMNAVILQDYCFLPDGTLCGASKRFFLK